MATDCGPYERPRRLASRRPEGTAIVGKVAAGVPTRRAPRTFPTVSRLRGLRPMTLAAHETLEGLPFERQMHAFENRQAQRGKSFHRRNVSAGVLTRRASYPSRFSPVTASK